MKKGLKRNRHGILAALDVGSSKICCLIARIEEGRGDKPRGLKVIGIGQQVSRGVKAGAVVDMEAAEAAILNAVHAAEQMAGETIEQVVVNLSGGYPASRSIGVEVSIDGHEVGDMDLRRALEQGHQLEGVLGQPEKGRQLIHSIPVGYTIDGSRGIRDPRGMYGERLGVNMHIVTAASGPVRNLATCVQRCHLEPGNFVVSPFASGLSSLVEDERELGVTLIDLGAGTTSMAVFLEGNVIHTDVVPVGGQHVTSDIARGLSTALSHAERLKTLYGHAIATSADEQEMIDVPQVGEEDDNHVQQVPRSLLVGIMQPRLEETFELVRSRLEASGFDKLGGRRVVLTGGAAQLPGMGDLAALVLDKQVRVGRPIHLNGLAESTSGPAYTTAAGLLNYALEAEMAPRPDIKPQTPEAAGLIGRVGNWLKEHF
ncbi:cell division protein FtsA [Fodinicurvata halophila]|uniref:Cell division protein FtsA n=1 Tax=Fodinicurvata halophila TaxID=1419723 RepID=A0ABV8UFH1_9PROT